MPSNSVCQFVAVGFLCVFNPSTNKLRACQTAVLFPRGSLRRPQYRTWLPPSPTSFGTVRMSAPYALTPLSMTNRGGAVACALVLGTCRVSCSGLRRKSSKLRPRYATEAVSPQQRPVVLLTTRVSDAHFVKTSTASKPPLRVTTAFVGKQRSRSTTLF